MLVTSRQRDEKVVFDFSQVSEADLADLRSGKKVIEVCVVDIRGDKVRLGSEAPKSVGVDREEVWKDKRKGRAA